jgi:four helix bundle protein
LLSERTEPRPPAADIRDVLSFKKLDVYQCSIQLLALTAEVLEVLGQAKGNAVIADQLKRAALSVPLNIGEGAGKSTPADQTKHYVIARGSAMECGAIYDAALVMKLVDAATATQAEELVTRIVGMLTKMCHFR